MKFLVIGDIHGKNDSLLQIVKSVYKQQFDLIICTGDIGPDILNNVQISSEFRKSLYYTILNSSFEMLSLLNKPILYISGNHDLNKPEINSPNIINIDILNGFDHHIIGNCRFCGLGGIPPTSFSWPYEWESDSIKVLQKFNNNTQDYGYNIFVSHCPPNETYLDILSDNITHAGSNLVRKLLKEIKPDILICGHIHESFGLDIIDGALCLNAGSILIDNLRNRTNPSDEHLNLLSEFNQLIRYYIFELTNKELIITQYTQSLNNLFSLPSIKYEIYEKTKILETVNNRTFVYDTTDSALSASSSIKFINRNITRLY